MTVIIRRILTATGKILNFSVFCLYNLISGLFKNSFQPFLENFDLFQCRENLRRPFCRKDSENVAYFSENHAI